MEHGVKIVHAGELEHGHAADLWMTRAAAITHARTGANKTVGWHDGGTADAKTGHIIMENWRPYFTWCRGACVCDGEITWNSAEKPGPEIYLCAALRAASEINASPMKCAQGGRGS